MKPNQKMVDAYLTIALWSTTHDDEPLEEQYGIADCSEKLIQEALSDLEAFCKSAGELLDGLDIEQVAHAFWLTRNRHGAGFWDRGLGEVGRKLTDIAHSFGEVDLYVGDDGEIYS